VKAVKRSGANLIFRDQRKRSVTPRLSSSPRIGAGLAARVVGKLEMRNPLGSVKDRVAVAERGQTPAASRSQRMARRTGSLRRGAARSPVGFRNSVEFDFGPQRCLLIVLAARTFAQVV
jgi:hypothetical protein